MKIGTELTIDDLFKLCKKYPEKKILAKKREIIKKNHFKYEGVFIFLGFEEFEDIQKV
jgi:hypothetical protein